MTNNRGQMGKFLEKIIKPGMIGIVAIIVVISLGFNAMAVPTCVMEAVNDIYTTPKNTSLHINADSGVLANDEICGQQVIVHWIGKVPDPDPLHGSVTLQTDGSFIYEPDADYSGTDYFHYTIAADPAICENDCLDYDFLVAVVTIIVDDPSDLIAHYKMDNDWLDSSGNDNHAVSNGAAFTESAVVGTHAGSFGGSSNLNLGVMGDTAQSSFSFWFKPGQNISGFLNSAQALLAKDGNNEHAFRIVINTDGRLGAGMHGVGIGSGDWVWTTQNVWYDNQWYHVAVTQEAGDFRLYVDGVLAGQNTGAAQMQSANYNLYVGTNWYANGNYFDGLIDDLMIYSRILTPEEIQNYYSENVSSDLIAHYEMDNDWQDSSGNDNHAASNGAAFTESAVVGTHAGSFGGSSNLNLGVMGDTAQSSFSFWFKPGQNISGFLNSAQALLAKDGNNEHAFRIVINTDGRLGAGMHGVGIGSGDWVWTTQNVWYDNQWYHVAVTQEAGDFRLYVDGVLAGQNTGAAQMQSANYNLYVGTNWYANGNYFDGLIDDLMIYSRILTPEEIQNYCQ